MEQVRFVKLHEWALPPVKEPVPPAPPSLPGLRWQQRSRVKGACWPYRLGKQIGWTILSPLELEIQPVTELQVEGDTDLEEVGELCGINFWVKREQTFIGLRPDGWFRMHQAKVQGHWHQLLIPNGECTFEWRLGWTLHIPDDFLVLIQPIEGQAHFAVHPGALPANTLDRFDGGLGFGLAFEPLRHARIRRGDPLAKLFVLPKAVLHMSAETVERFETSE